MSDPAEVWLQLERGRTSGRYRIRARILKAYDVGGGRAVVFVADQQDGVMVEWTFFASGDMRYINRQRQGVLYWMRESGEETP